MFCSFAGVVRVRSLPAQGWAPANVPEVNCGGTRLRVVDQPWRCLWRRFSQMTMTRPWRRMTLHLSQIGLTLGLTFTVGLPLSWDGSFDVAVTPAVLTCSGRRCARG